MTCSLLLLAILSVVPPNDSSLKPPRRATRFDIDHHRRYSGTGATLRSPAVYAPRSSSSSLLMAGFFDFFGMVEHSDLLYDSTSTAFDAWEWTSNMGAPSALVAAAVLVSLTETRQECAPHKTDARWVRFTKRLMRFLLMTSFAFEVLSIFVGNMTGSMLLGHGAHTVAKNAVGYGSPLELVHHHHEMEYLLTQISFLQGLMHWLAAVVCELLLPRPSETTSAKLMNKCLASWLITLVLSIVSFYNSHVNFYSGYGSMICRLFVLLGRRLRKFPPMSLLWGPSFVASTVLTWRAFTSPPRDD